MLVDLDASRPRLEGTGRSTESDLEQALERASYDSDEELEAIRDSVRSLREQRAAVEKLKEKARSEEGTAEALRRKLAEAERRIRELRAQGGRDVVRRLMDEVRYLWPKDGRASALAVGGICWCGSSGSIGNVLVVCLHEDGHRRRTSGLS